MSVSGKPTLYSRLCSQSLLFDAWKAVKQKGSAGGVDGVTLLQFEERLGGQLSELLEELRQHKWKPEPYLRVNIPKKSNEIRRLGLLSVRDKVVQQGMKMLLEPRFEKVFVPNSYGYRPGKGHTKAVKFARYCCQAKATPYLLRLDIDNYFDNVDHSILFKRLAPLVADEEMLSLIQLCVNMGVVNKSSHWQDVTVGLPQGAVLSPLLANFYLTPFDQYVLTRTKNYVRYADDFIICCESEEQASDWLQEGSAFLTERLKLTLNPPSVSLVKDGFEFLGVMIDNHHVYLSESKKEDLAERIRELGWSGQDFDKKGKDSLSAILRYYAPLVSNDDLVFLDKVLVGRLCDVVTEHCKEIPNKSVLRAALNGISFISRDNELRAASLRSELIDHYCSLKDVKKSVSSGDQEVRKAIRQRKLEYRKKEGETTDLVITTPGTFLGAGEYGLVLKIAGKKKKIPSVSNLEHICIMCDGVSLSSNLVKYCVDHKIGLHFFTWAGMHLGSLMTQRYISTSLWQKQSSMTLSLQSRLASAILQGKMKNQLNLIKYFHKYHKATSGTLCNVYDDVLPKVQECVTKVRTFVDDPDYRSKMMGQEALCAELYWSYIRELISDDNVNFERRTRQGATDLVNCMLNYGYAMIYPRVWQALLLRKLNPVVSVIHVPQQGKPTFVYDVVELFRAQAVERVVISLIQKKEPLKITDGKLGDEIRKLLVRNILERLNRYEKYRGVEMRLADIINAQALEIANFIDKGATYRPYVAKW